MAERNPFHELLENLDEDDWEQIEEELLHDDNGPGGPSTPRSGGGNGGQGGGGRLLWWMLVPFLILILFNTVLGFYTDWLWYDSLQLTSVFFTRIGASLGLFAAGALAFWLVFVFNVLLVRRLNPQGLDETPLFEAVQAVGVRITPVVLLVGAFFAFFMGTGASSAWEELLLYFNQQPFGMTDPIFGRDVSFFLFTLPIWQFLRGWLMTTLVITLIATGLASGIGWRGWGAPAAVRAHLSCLGALILLLIAWQYRLDALELVYSARGAVFGAGYTDVNAQLPAFTILVFVTIIAAILLLVNVFLQQAWRAIVVVLVGWIAISALAGNIYPNLVQRFQVNPNEFTREREYIAHNIDFTRAAFGLDRIVDENFDAESELTGAELLDQPDTIRNIRLWDYRPLLQTYNQVQALRQQYQFTDIDIDRYDVEGERRQLMLSARELIPEQLEQPAQTWVNRKLVYTHGYGVAASPVAEITPDGLPTFVLQDLPVQGILDVNRPQIYFGERTNEYVIVKTETEEFDYPRGEGGNVFTTFEGDTGIRIGGFLPRLAFAIQFADINLFISQELTPESQLLWRRNILQRTLEVAPFLRFDSDPYIVVGGDGNLYWFLDAYTVSGRFPYSEPSQFGTRTVPPGFNYIRNPVKIIIDAYTGEMKFYLVEPDEPIAAAYARIFPSLFTSFEEMPEDLNAHIRYPNDLFSIQASVFRTYQMTEPTDFYNREDVWAWPEEIFDNQSRPMEPYYVLMQLPGSEDLDFIQILPFTPANRENMISWLAAQNDPEKYGEMLVYRFGKDSLVFGPKQIEARIDQDPTISSLLSLWNQQGSQVIRGNLLVIPIGESLLYVEPLYLQAATGKIPELKRVILATSDRVIMAENLGLALAELFGQDILTDTKLAELAISGDGELPAELPAAARVEVDIDLAASSLEELILEANNRYAKAQEALMSGDWAAYGAELEGLEMILERMLDLSGLSPDPTPQPTQQPLPAPTPAPAAEESSG
ncbi:MAG: UPF0182 family protein [Caldilineaceae bacterium SB0661_bin_32]|uniref:UPF0182 protein F4X14_10790 n=1 Tax=Caldilineaceae bacterium SB0661_bin_32 TaxID=2605255 RepID=A0A6B1D7A9_9CHLR|nr:UPF0182 family protein [Caldilineaceae bacterium SB0661_bin_32]